MQKISNYNFNLIWAPLFWSLVCARSLERRWRRLSNKQGHSKHAATKMEKTPHFAHWASTVNIVKKHALCVNPDFELIELNASINKTTFFGSGGLQETHINHYNYLVQNRWNCPSRRVSLQNLPRWPIVLAPRTVVSPTNRDRLREEAKVVLKRRCCC